MAKRLFNTGAVAWTNQVYSAALTSSTYMSLLGASATQTTDILEILISGTSSASNVAAFELCRSSGTVTSGATALASPNSDGPMHPATAALAAPVVAQIAATTNPQPSAVITDAKLNLTLNSFGGIIRWNAAPTQQWTMVGASTGFGVSILFNSTTSGATSAAAANAHIIYEPY